MLDRRAFLAGMASVVAAPVVADGQPSGKVHKLGVLSELTSTSAISQRWRSALRRRGYIEGQNIVLELRFADERVDRLPRLADELVRLNVELILTTSTPAAVAARKSTSIIPIITMSGDPVAAGLVVSLARPESNVTGVFVPLQDLGAKQLQLLKEAVPNLTSVAIVWNPGNPATKVQATSTEAAARAFGIVTHSIEFRDQGDLEKVAKALDATRVRGMVVMLDTATVRAAPGLAELALKRRLPSSHTYRQFVEAQGLMSYGVSLDGLYDTAVTYVDRVLRGAMPADLPMEQPTRFEFVINLKTAKALGLTIPPSLLLRADQVIE